MLLPATSEARATLVKRAKTSQAVLVKVKELQLCLPGSCRHLADEVRAGCGSSVPVLMGLPRPPLCDLPISLTTSGCVALHFL